MNRARRWSAIAAAVLLAAPASAEVRLPHIFGEHMVLQADRPLLIWGWDAPGERVTAALPGDSARAVADANGRWRAVLSPRTASAQPVALTVTGRNRITIADVLIGEVWIAGGQSNMDKPIGPWPGQRPTTGWQATLAGATMPELRFFDVADGQADRPGEDVEGHWFVSSPAALERTHFSAIGYLFAHRLSAALHRPVAVVNTAVGGSRIEPWIPPGAFAAAPSLADIPAAWGSRPRDQDDARPPASLWNAMVAPLAGFAARGWLWYQGESNVFGSADDDHYADKMVALVAGWRAAWGATMPFYYVQIAPFLYHVAAPDRVASPQTAARLMAAQAAAGSRISRSGMVVTSDLVDDLMDLHPADKAAVASRLANWALARDYGVKVPPVESPRFRALRIDGNAAVVTLDHAAGLHVTHGGRAQWFQVAGIDGVFRPAIARIVKDAVILTSADVVAPVAVRFGWDEAARPNLANGAGLPVIAFDTSEDASRPIGVQP